MKKKIFLGAWLCLLVCSSCTNEKTVTPFLSKLSVKAGAPLYTTYAAAMERSSFLLDEGYILDCFDAEQPLRFSTDTGGEWILAFKAEDKWIYRIADYHQAPEITASYPDFAQISAWPTPEWRVEWRFAVYSSRAALLDLELFNEAGEEKELTYVPVFRQTLRPFHSWSLENQQHFSFLHESFPDGWTINQQLPHVDSIQNLFSMSVPADSVFVLQSAHPSGAWPGDVYPDLPAELALTGRTFTSDGERIMERVALQAYMTGNPDFLLTEDSPIKGLPQAGIDLDGYRRTELSWLPGSAAGQSFDLMIYDEGSGEGGTISASAATGRKDMTLGQLDFLPPAKNIHWQNGDFSALSWDPVPGVAAYSIYQRAYPEAFYRRIAQTSTTHFEVGVTGNQENLLGYLVVPVDALNRPGMHSRELLNRHSYELNDFLAGRPQVPTQQVVSGMGFIKNIKAKAGQSCSLRISRLVAPLEEVPGSLLLEQQALSSVRMDDLLQANEALYASVPKLDHPSRDIQLLYYSAFNMLRQVFYPPEGKSSYNYYVFSREPTWGWGHGGQVFHESISMLSYVLMDPESAMNSQRVYAERQYDNGYINYRTGSWLDEIIEYEGELTSSAPWYNWINAEIYRSTGDVDFLSEMYASGKRFYQFYTQNRDKDGDGLCEWGGHAVLESVRDAAVAVWDEVGWPSEFEGVDVNSMLVMEAKALAFMAEALGLSEEAALWRADYEQRSKAIMEVFWDEHSGFFYNADKKDNDFTYRTPDDLKRMEIIGFLPLWAGIADSLTAKRVIEEHLLDENKFWRKYGVPSLSAEDSYYNAKGYWNGPVWVEWNLFIVQALLNYGYRKEAKQLVDRLAEGMLVQLRENNNLWEFYSPDEAWAGYHKTYIWAAIINRMLLDTYGVKK